MASSPNDPTGAAGNALTVTTHQGAIWVIVLGGAVLVALADYAPHLVNGFLLLLLSGVILRHSDVWSAWFQSVSQHAS